MNICRMSGSHIPLLISIACCCAFFLYFNFRVNDVKYLVEKQNKVLTSFITNFQQDIKLDGCPHMPIGKMSSGENHIAAPEAIRSAQEYAQRQETDEKIVVSDDEDDDEDDDDSDSDSESDEESDCESDGDAEHTQTGGSHGQLKMVDVTDMINFSSTMVVPVSFELLTDESIESSLNVASDSSITELKEDDLNLEELTSTSTTNYDSMKVDELRKVVSDKNLSTKEEVKKLKKPELVALLKK